MNKIKEVNVNNERVFLKKGFLGWHVAYPCKIDNKINWKNLIAGGNYWRLLIIAFIIFIILGCVWEYSIVLKSLNECMEITKWFTLIN